MEIKMEIDAHPQQTYLRIREHHFSECISHLGRFVLCALFKDHFKVDLYLNGWKMEKMNERMPLKAILSAERGCMSDSDIYGCMTLQSRAL